MGHHSCLLLIHLLFFPLPAWRELRRTDLRFTGQFVPVDFYTCRAHWVQWISVLLLDVEDPIENLTQPKIWHLSLWEVLLVWMRYSLCNSWIAFMLSCWGFWISSPCTAISTLIALSPKSQCSNFSPLIWVGQYLSCPLHMNGWNKASLT